MKRVQKTKMIQKKEKNKKMRFNWLEVIGIGLIIASGVIAVQIYYHEKTNECSSNPLVYAAKMYEKNTGYEFMGQGTFISRDEQINSPTIYFSSSGLDFLNIINGKDIYKSNLSLNNLGN